MYCLRCKIGRSQGFYQRSLLHSLLCHINNCAAASESKPLVFSPSFLPLTLNDGLLVSLKCLIGHSTLSTLHSTILNNIQVLADLGQKVLVVAHQENTAVELLQSFDKCFGRLKIKMVGGF